MLTVSKPTAGILCTVLALLPERIEAKEAVEERFIRLNPGMRGLSYQEILNTLGLEF